jgi:hypothetical protein
MKCCHCSHNAFTTIDGAALCLNCHTDFQNTANKNVSSALQLSRGIDVADSMFKARVALQCNQSTDRQVNNARSTEVNNYNTHNNITVHGNNNGILNTGKAQIKNNNIAIASSAKSDINLSWLTKIFISGLKLITLCLQPFKRLF